MKQAIVVRSDLGMGKGKIAAQVAHASLSAAEAAQHKKPGWYAEWKDGGQAKIVLKAGSEGDLRELFRRAKSAGLPAALIEDRGLTQVEPGSVTCMAVGPAPDGDVDAITGKLKLL
ncbi:MAG: peptidyl-tRNA hydrolase [Nitrososphaerota archaeon]|jgi:PTH2 family peptidyl-tRNA hydrolase|nr:peptidyl-tRNA hydrolase [Nitrososphaerota archaeon]MDG6959159.1 peptidyl-tRNA hydrolase [Nitrososphaerota archaeon]MDG6968802.1 peptidyl-tRNA hydrolase [Nitrososphaerota archaeon]MDG6973557.1 peptidyl-tRNA hydrolase [Nitrososphaerota archaeon]MDG6976664.1 peptidyl-tRNA hydrolase [Nitrososphaerota archaeon]